MRIDWRDAEHVMREADFTLPRPLANALTDLFHAMAKLRYDDMGNPAFGSLEVQAALERLDVDATAGRESA